MPHPCSLYPFYLHTFSLLQLQHLAPGPGGFLQLLSTPGVGQELGINTFPFPQEQLSTSDVWELVANAPISPLLWQDNSKCVFYTGSQTCAEGGGSSHTFTGCLSFPVKLFYSPSSHCAGSGDACRGIQTKKGSEREMKILWADWQDQQRLSLHCISCCATTYRQDICKESKPGSRHPGE